MALNFTHEWFAWQANHRDTSKSAQNKLFVLQITGFEISKPTKNNPIVGRSKEKSVVSQSWRGKRLKQSLGHNKTNGTIMFLSTWNSKCTRVLVFTSAVRTRESSPGNTFVTQPSNQRDLGTVLSTTRTRSFTAKFLLFSSHLWRCCKVGAYSRTHRDQKQLARNWVCLHFLREYSSSLAKTPGGMARFRRCRSRWFGVSGSMSLGSSLAGEMGRLLRIDVTSANTVHMVSKGTAAPGLLKTAFIAFRTLLISLSHTPEMWLTVGGLGNATLATHIWTNPHRRNVALSWFVHHSQQTGPRRIRCSRRSTWDVPMVNMIVAGFRISWSSLRMSPTGTLSHRCSGCHRKQGSDHHPQPENAEWWRLVNPHRRGSYYREHDATVLGEVDLWIWARRLTPKVWKRLVWFLICCRDII